MLSLLRHLSAQRWLSKRIIVVMVDGGTDPNGWDGGLDLGVQRWIQDYTSGHLPQTGGALRGAVLLDVAPGTSLHELGVAMQGSNGLLSNLDLVNLMTKSRHPVRRKYSRVVATTRKHEEFGGGEYQVVSDGACLWDWGVCVGGSTGPRRCRLFFLFFSWEVGLAFTSPGVKKTECTSVVQCGTV